MNEINKVQIGNLTIGGEKLILLSGPCVIESLDLCRTVCEKMVSICSELGIGYVFKASIDKANRTSSSAFRGCGFDDGLEVLAKIKSEFNVPIVTDIHESYQAVLVSRIADILQIPAFLCRQTDLLYAAAVTGKAVNVKKGQFLAPWDTKNIVEKLHSFGCKDIMLTERGTSFGYNSLVVDMSGLPIMRSYGVPVVFDATHSAQLPGGSGNATAGRREIIPTLAKAAMAVGIDALFMETHPDPELGFSDTATMYPLEEMKELLKKLLDIREVVSK